jgi:hypothetical protein
MPIDSAFWGPTREQDIHVLRGSSAPDLRDQLFFSTSTGPQSASIYLGSNNDVTLSFSPFFSGTLSGSDFVGAGNGIRVNAATGAVAVDPGQPLRRKNNFIIRATARNTSPQGNQNPMTELVRVQVHTSVKNVWLTPDHFTVRPTRSPVDLTHYKFSVRVEFDDGVVGDLTDNHGVTWAATSNGTSHAIGTFGEIEIDSSDNPNDVLIVTATLPANFGGGSAQAQVRVERAWAKEPNPPKVEVVAGGGWPGAFTPDQSPNVLLLGDGFKAADQAAFDGIAVSLVHHLKNTHLVSPFDVLATSINFWKVVVPATDHGISVLSEVYVFTQDGRQFARPVPLAVDPKTATEWTVENLIFAAGLPVAADAGKSRGDLRAEWSQLVSPDPSPFISGGVIDEWKELANRTFIEEQDGIPGMSYGQLPSANSRNLNELSLHPRRGHDPGLRALCGVLANDSFALSNGGKIGTLWAAMPAGARFDNTKLVVLFSSFPGGRQNNTSATINFSTRAGNVEIPVKPAAPGLPALQLDVAGPPTAASVDTCRTFAHELGHSLGLGDEYVDDHPSFHRNYPFDETALKGRGNVQTEADARTGRPGNVLHSTQVKWNWHRVAKAAVIAGPITQFGDQFLIPLVRGGLQFTAQDRLLLRLRPPGVLRRASEVSQKDTLDEAKALKLVGAPQSLQVAVSRGSLTLGDVARFVPGSILFAPPPPIGGQTPHMIAPNIASFIDGNRSLTVSPCEVDLESTQDPIIPGVSLPGVFCFSHKPEIVGLYSGGARYSCAVFHPAGACMMRDQHEEETKFCAVCRYIVVDMIDPYHHQDIDLDYADIYPAT